MRRRHELSDEQWAKIEPLVPGREGDRERAQLVKHHRSHRSHHLPPTSKPLSPRYVHWYRATTYSEAAPERVGGSPISPNTFGV